ncbi:GATA transcription factor 1-like [Phoenix dactylifera]|uniref:GATA transcription factor 1-like n=1 Tax=Phoenix dactylifera TaxID=42345 RepID=A0A8B7D3L6_PHODC|nr:GATA transcription factor 1-like [Phoenix dactylifera]
MVDPLEEAPEGGLAAADLLLLDFPSDIELNPPPHRRNPSPMPPSTAGGLQDQSLLDILEDSADIPAVDGLPGLAAEGGGGGGGQEEEELEWLLNKDAFPALETSFEIPTHLRSSGSGGTGSSGGASSGAVAGRTSPVSVLAAAAPFRVPGRPRSKGRRRRVLARVSPAPVAREAKDRRRCRHCEAEDTPQWRAGPEGPKTLCNACGVRYKSGRLVPEYRPAASPTFSAAIHSNSHRRIMEMRCQNLTRGRPRPATPVSRPAL